MKGLIFILFCLSSLPAYCQVVAIQNDNYQDRPIVYLCIENPLTVAVSNCPSNTVTLSTNDGKISGKLGHFQFIPQHVGRATIFVKRKTPKGEKIIDSMYLKVKPIPIKAYLDGKSGGEISKSILTNQIALQAPIENFDIDARFTIVSFNVIVHRKNEEIFKRNLSNPKGVRIDFTTNTFFTTLNNNDTVLFTDITIKDCDGTARRLNSLEFTITDAEKYINVQHDENEIIIDPITGTEVRRSEVFPK